MIGLTRHPVTTGVVPAGCRMMMMQNRQELTERLKWDMLAIPPMEIDLYFCQTVPSIYDLTGE